MIESPEKRRLVMAVSPDDFAGLYLDGKLIWDFYSHDPFRGSLGISNGWDDALEILAEKLSINYEVESRYQSVQKYGGYGGEPEEYDTYWPDDIVDAPLVKYDEKGRIIFG